MKIRALREKFKTASLWIGSSLIDAGFLVLWTLMQWLVAQALEYFSLSGIDAWVLLTFRLVFAFTTLATIVIYVYMDVRVMVIRTRRRIKREIGG